jgi:hypothetical protein
MYLLFIFQGAQTNKQTNGKNIYIEQTQSAKCNVKFAILITSRSIDDNDENPF